MCYKSLLKIQIDSDLNYNKKAIGKNLLLIYKVYEFATRDSNPEPNPS